MKSRDTTRRSFLKSALAAGIAPMFVPSKLFGQNAPSNQLQLGHIGLGGHGTQFNLQNFLRQPDCRCAVMCDAFRDRREKAADIVNKAYGSKDCRVVEDFREIINDPSLDAVVISTPDHWHVPMSMMALDAGKHVFCEKPTYRIREGRALADKVMQTGLIFSTGLEDRSLVHYHKLVEWERNGAIGDLYHVDVALPPGQINPADEPAPVPEGLNWELWLGPAPYHPYTPTRTGWLNWRYIRDYSTGVITDWGTHLVDTAQLAANDPHGCAIEVKGWGAPIPPNSQTDIPAHFELHYRYSNGVSMTVRDRGDGEKLGKHVGIKLLGSKGWVEVYGWRGSFSASDPAILKTKYTPENSKHWPMPKGEHRNFLDSIRSGQTPTYPAETLHLLSTSLHMGLIAIDVGRPLRFDPRTERFKNDPEANQHLERSTHREDWKRA